MDKLETALKIVRLHKERHELESHMPYLNRDLDPDNNVKVELKNGHNGGYCWMRSNSFELLYRIHKTTMDYIEERTAQIDKELDDITIEDGETKDS